MRDGFSNTTRLNIARRAGFKCSCPICRKPTTRPSSTNVEKGLTLGDAAHITAASPGGTRYNPSMTPEQRKSAVNGIWLCKDCAYKIDHEPEAYSVETLTTWKKIAEQKAARESAVRQDNIQLIINEIDNVTKKINNFLDRWMRKDPDYQYMFKSHVGKTEEERHAEWLNNCKLSYEYSRKMSRAYVKTIAPDIQDILIKCREVFGESDECIKKSFEALDASSVNRIGMEHMVYALQELKSTLVLK